MLLFLSLLYMINSTFILCVILSLSACNAEEKRLQNELDYCQEESDKMKRQLAELSETVEFLESQLEDCQTDLKRCRNEISDLEFENLMRD